MGEIARAAGVSKGTLYVYFADKSRLFEAIVEREMLDQQKVAFNFDPNATSSPRCGSSAKPISRCSAGRAADRRSARDGDCRADAGGRPALLEHVLEKTINRLAGYLEARVKTGDVAIPTAGWRPRNS